MAVIDVRIPKTFDSFLTSPIVGDKNFNDFHRCILEVITEDPRLEKRAERKWNQIYALWNSLWERDRQCSAEFEYKLNHLLGKEGYEKSWKRRAIVALQWAEERRSLLNKK